MKKVNFNENITYYKTYSCDEYDRTPVDSLLTKFLKKEIMFEEYVQAIKKLNSFKISEMLIHIDSIPNFKL